MSDTRQKVLLPATRRAHECDDCAEVTHERCLTSLINQNELAVNDAVDALVEKMGINRRNALALLASATVVFAMEEGILPQTIATALSSVMSERIDQEMRGNPAFMEKLTTRMETLIEQAVEKGQEQQLLNVPTERLMQA